MYSGSSTERVTPSVLNDSGSLMTTALAELAERTRFPIVFGGFVAEDQVVVSHLLGNKQDTLRGLVVQTGWGLGGRALQERRPRLTNDYGASRTITHDYDRPVLAEGITTLFAIPVTVHGTVAAVLYGGLRTPLSIGGVSLDQAVTVARDLSTRLTVLSSPGMGSATTVVPTSAGSLLGTAQMEELRHVYAELRSITAQTADPELRAQMSAVETRIVALANGGHVTVIELDEALGQLTPRERDALSVVALGYTNASVGRTLGVTEATVKSYLNSAMHKLGASTRFEAVAIARRAGLLV